jgi:nucleoside-diphosphate-sugar epimerase
MGPLVARLSPLSNERVLVTGMSGFKGTWLAVWLRLLGCDVVGLSLEPDTSPSLFDDCAILSFATHFVVDLRDREHGASDGGLPFGCAAARPFFLGRSPQNI